MKVSMTPFQQHLIGAAILYALDAGFLQNSGNRELMLWEFQKVFDHMTIDTPVKTGGSNAIAKKPKSINIHEILR